MAGEERIERNSAVVAEYERRAKESGPGASGDLIKSIWNGFGDSSDLHIEYKWEKGDYHKAFYAAYRELCGHGAGECETLGDFFGPELVSALESFFGKEETARIRDECALIMECPFPRSIFRPAFRSRRVGYYKASFFSSMVDALSFICIDTTLENALAAKQGAPPYGSGPLEDLAYVLSSRLSGLDHRLALELRRGDESAFSLVEEAILGDNSKVRMSRTIISGIVKSGSRRALELLAKLLLAAKGQEGLRQAIVELCVSGTLSSQVYFMRLILENGLCRFSSVVREFDAWTGLGYDYQKQKVAEKCMSLALKYLTDESALGEGLNSNDATEIYLALWALCCHDNYGASSSAWKLLGSPEKYRRLVGWYFITHNSSDSSSHGFAVERLDVRDPEELAWVCSNLHINKNIYFNSYMWNIKDEQSLKTMCYFDKFYPADKAERTELFGRLADVAAFIGKKNTRFAGSVFPWLAQELNASAPCGVMLGLAAYDRCADLTRRLKGFLPIMDADLRLLYYGLLLDPETPEQRAFLLEGMSDRSKSVREHIVNRLRHYPLGEPDIERMAETLATQNAGLRKGIVTLFKEQEEPLIRPAIDALLRSANKNQLIAGVELLDVFSKGNPSLLKEYREIIDALAVDEGLSGDVSILLERVAPGKRETESFTEENGYGLYDPACEAFDLAAAAAKRPPVPRIGDGELKSLIVPDEKAVIELYERLSAVFEKYRDYEYETENYYGTREKVLLNDDKSEVRLLAGAAPRHSVFGNPITDYPLADEWLEAAGEFSRDKAKLAAVLSLWSDSFGPGKTYCDWFRDLFAGYPINGPESGFRENMAKRAGAGRAHVIRDNQILRSLMNTGEAPLFDFAFSAYVNLVRKIPEGKLGMRCEEEDERAAQSHYPGYRAPSRGALTAGYLVWWRLLAQDRMKTDGQFADYFNEMWYQYLAAGQQEFHGLRDEHIYRAYQMGLIPGDAVCFYLTAAVDAPKHMDVAAGFYSQWNDLFVKYPAAKPLLDTAVDRIATLEEARGELPAALSKVASHISGFDGGTGHFASLLAALGDSGFHRGYSYSFLTGGELTKKEGLSRLLRGCRPKPGDTPEVLREALKRSKVPEKRAIQAAVYAPQWAGLLEKATGVDGLKCGVWFFHAHINEDFTAEKETEAAIFSAISPQQFNDGAFDRDWFHEAYGTLGEKRFGELYKNAKYITGSSLNHRRSQLYADAVLGRLDKDVTRKEIIEKRNQEKLRAYPLIPLDEGNKNDAVERYEFIQQFKKESGQFGALRQASEVKACEAALGNLAITTGYADVDRMTWALEGAKIEQLRPLMEPHPIGGIEAWLSVDADGTPNLNIRKDGKPLKALPKESARDPYASELKGAVKQLRDQKRRARAIFEKAMVSRAGFSAGELAGLLGHPVLRGMVSALVFMQGDGLGFPALVGGKLMLVGADGASAPVRENEQLIIAHPYDFISKKLWSGYQKHLYHNKVVQPFKQVFREYYPVTEDELDAVNMSRRYAGNQVQPRKAAALFKARGWTADYREGLQRVWHKENLIARVYALADWFTPADIEAPTLEAVQFFSRDGYEPAPFADVPPVVFSETMRDIDLAVSVAHAGGVDPEASHSTVEMRIAISRELLAMLSVGNVSFKAAHARIKGSLGEYSVHMGSGVVHKSGTGMIAVLPVHSQARGRIFLPFADDDPKTAEILSKILLFADDKKIRDPSILKQL